MSPRKVDSEARKQQILEAATAVFARKGFDGASMDDIVKESGLSKGGLYWHFKSKDDIISAILQQFFEQEVVESEAVLAVQGNASERLHLLMQQLVDDLVQMGTLLPLSMEFYAVAARQENVRSFLSDYYERYRRLLETLIQQGIDAGEFAEVPITATAVTVMAQFEGLILLWTINPEWVDLRQHSQTAVSVLMNGLRRGV